MANDTSNFVTENIDAVVRSEEALTKDRSTTERLGDTIGRFAGRLTFVVVQLGAVAAWVLANAGLLPGVRVFDPFPYSLGGALLSLEGVLLASFVLMKQAHEGRLSERRSHLNLQANLLVEKEVTKLIQMVHRKSAAEGIEDQVVDAETVELSEVTAVDKLTDELDRRLTRD